MKCVFENSVPPVLLLLILIFSSCGTTETEDQTNYHNKILFTSSRSGKEQLYMMNADGSDIKQITSGEYWHNNGRWSPDAKKIVCNTEEGSTTAGFQMVVMDVDGSNRKLLGYGNQMSWHPDGNKITFYYLPSAELGNLSSNIYIMNIDGAEQKKITNDSGLIERSPCWSKDGNFIYFSSNRHDPLNNNPEIYKMNSNGANITRVTFTPNGYNTSPSISLDGSTIAVVSKRQEISIPSIFIMDVDSLKPKEIARPPLGKIFNYPRWSPDGEKIIFLSCTVDGSQKCYLYIVNKDGSNLQRVTDDAVVTSCDWSK